MANTFVGRFAGSNVTSGQFNLVLGHAAGSNLQSGNSNIIIGGSGGSSSESNTIRIGEQGTGSFQQNTVYIAGISSNTISNGNPVFVDANGMLGIGSGGGNGVSSFNGRTGAVTPQAGDYDFSQLSGQVGAAQLVGSYPSASTAPLPGSANYVQNGTGQQPGTNFNIDGDGTAGGTLTGALAVNTNGTYQVNGITAVNITTDGSNLTAVGTGTGSSHAANNTLVGANAGQSLTQFGSDNTFLGSSSGSQNTQGHQNTFVGSAAGQNNTNGINSTYIGFHAGQAAIGRANTFLGALAGANTSTGQFNLFLGQGTGNNIQSGNSNILIGNPGGSSSESNTIRIGDQGTGPAQQNAVYIAGINGNSYCHG